MANAINDIVSKVNLLLKNTQKYNEESTKVYIIYPFFKWLGYDLTDPNEVRFEVPSSMQGSRRVDFVIYHKEKPIMVVEAKSIGTELYPHIGQIKEYFIASGAKYGIITDGDEYKVFADTQIDSSFYRKDPLYSFNLTNLSFKDFLGIKQLSKSDITGETTIDDVIEEENGIDDPDLYTELRQKKSNAFKEYSARIQESSIDVADIKTEQKKADDAVREKFDHVQIAERIIKDYILINYNGKIYEYRDNYYQPAIHLRKYVRDAYAGIKRNQVGEVVDYINDMKMIDSDSVITNPFILNLRNTRLNIDNGDLLPFSSEAIEFDRIDVDYNPTAHDMNVDRVLKRVFCNDNNLIALFEEVIGYILMKNCVYAKGFLFTGEGANGKSTVIQMLEQFIGKNNYSTISLRDFSAKYALSALENKLANFGDDISSKALKETEEMKKVFAGNPLQVERKGEKPFVLKNYATPVFSCNRIPMSSDNSYGFYRRWIIIPFRATFLPTDPDNDPDIEDKITTDNAKSYLLNLGIRGARRLRANGMFTVPESVGSMLSQYQTENSSTLTWIDDQGFDESYMLSVPRDDIFDQFKKWCRDSGVRNVPGKVTFNREIINYFEFDEKPKQKSDKKRYFSKDNQYDGKYPKK